MPGGMKDMLRKTWFQLALFGAAALLVFVLTLCLSGANWELAAMATAAAVILLLAPFTLLRMRFGPEPEPLPQLHHHGEPQQEPAPVPAPQPEPAEDQESLADRYYFKGAWFTVTIHPQEEGEAPEARRIDLAGPLCPNCGSAMLPAHEREPLAEEGQGHTHVYKCRKSTVHKLVSVQLADPDPLLEQARRACLHDLVTGRFDSPRDGEEDEEGVGPRHGG